MTARIFVGTLHSGEADYLGCCRALNRQTGVTVTHHVVHDLPEREAHNALWHAWNAAKQDHDLFVKLDADVVLAGSTTLSEIYDQFAKRPEATGLQAPLQDYMTMSLIDGLNAYRPCVEFRESEDDLYCDRNITVGNDVVLRGPDLPPWLRPVGFHCMHADERQGFHFGFHRAMKKQDHVIQRVINVWAHEYDRTRGFAIIGAFLAPKLSKERQFNYTDDAFKAAYQDVVSRYDEYVEAIKARRFEAFD